MIAERALRDKQRFSVGFCNEIAGQNSFPIIPRIIRDHALLHISLDSVSVTVTFERCKARALAGTAAMVCQGQGP